MKKTFKALIVDDEKLARQDLLSLLKDFSEIQVVGEAGNSEEAKQMIAELEPEVIFLDIQMPGKDGFELLQELNTKAKIIFVTAYDEYAIKAFEVNAQDYLLKPVNDKRLAAAIEHLKYSKQENETNKNFDYNDSFFLMINNAYQFLKISSIISISSAGNYSEVITSTKLKGLVLKSMLEWENKLPSNYFVRVHRNAIINLEYIDHVEEWFNYSYQVYMKGLEKPVLMSRRYAAKLKEIMS
jgi:two-component system LytT family response regulator